jgi:hypothetical protein
MTSVMVRRSVIPLVGDRLLLQWRIENENGENGGKMGDFSLNATKSSCILEFCVVL